MSLSVSSRLTGFSFQANSELEDVIEEETDEPEVLRHDSIEELSVLECSNLSELQAFSPNISTEEEYEEDVSLYLAQEDRDDE